MLLSRCVARTRLRANSIHPVRSASTYFTSQRHVQGPEPSEDESRLDKRLRNVAKNGIDTNGSKRGSGAGSTNVWKDLQIPDDAPVIMLQTDKPGLPHIHVSFAQKHIYLWHGNRPDHKKVLQAQAVRDNCPCPSCRDVSSGQKSFATTQIPPRMYITNVREVPEGLAVTFDVDIRGFKNHETIITREDIDNILKRKDMITTDHPGKHYATMKLGLEYWDAKQIRQHMGGPGYSYESYMEGGDTMWKVVSDLVTYGIAFLRDVPQDPDSVIHITTKLANIQETFYGRTFDVRAKPNAENVAYTSGYLGLHQDLLYLQSPPKIQILHCMENSCEGGESLFADGDRVGKMLYTYLSSIDALKPLAELEIPYAYKMNGYNYEQLRPVLEGTTSGQNFWKIWWSPPFQGRFVLPYRNMRPWIRAARIFENMVNHPLSMYERMMQPGECVLFDNHRVLHGRNAFDAAGGGSRWFRGAYISEEDFYSKASRVPQEMLRKDGGSGWANSTSATSFLLSYMKEELQKGLDVDDAQFQEARREIGLKFSRKNGRPPSTFSSRRTGSARRSESNENDSWTTSARTQPPAETSNSSWASPLRQSDYDPDERIVRGKRNVVKDPPAQAQTKKEDDDTAIPFFKLRR